MRPAAFTHAIETTLADLRNDHATSAAPRLASLTVLTLGLGIGATTAIFSLVNAMLLEDLPLSGGEQLLFVGHDLTGGNLGLVPLAGAELNDLRERTTSFAGIGVIWSNTTMITGENPEELRIGLVATDLFDVLGASAAYGRTLHGGRRKRRTNDGSLPCAVAAALRRRSLGRRQHDPRQRRAADHRRRHAARVSHDDAPRTRTSRTIRKRGCRSSRPDSARLRAVNGSCASSRACGPTSPSRRRRQRSRASV